MKYYLILGALSLALIAGASHAKADVNIGVGFDIFYSSLSPYGEWVNVDFGRAWRPMHVGYGWRPYLNGRWIWSDYGWYWASDEPFGWATFHYGRWTYDDYYGWIWIPDDVWGPAWVEWRYNDDYVGWAPLTPYHHFDFSIGITLSNRWVTPVHYWNFVSCRNFTSVHINAYVQPIERSRRFFGSTRASINIGHEGDRVINRGVDVNFIERRGNVRINRAEVVGSESRVGERMTRDAGRDRIEVYRPRIEGVQRGQNESKPQNDSRIMGGESKRPTENRIQRETPPPQSRYNIRTPDRNQLRPQPDYRRFQPRPAIPQPNRQRMPSVRPQPLFPQPMYRNVPRGNGNRNATPPRPTPRRDDGHNGKRP
ncbi:MAG: DUF6600 domain-containing protein [Bacteroidota bacterium]